MACTGNLATAGMVAHSGDDDTAQAGGSWDGSAGARGQRRVAPTEQASEYWRDDGAVAIGGDRVGSPGHGREEGTDGDILILA
jgi:hypothetical protein